MANSDGTAQTQQAYQRAPQQFPEYPGATVLFTDPASGVSPTIDPKEEVAQFPVMGSPNLPIWIKVSKTPEPTYIRFLHILQMVTAIFFVLFLIGFMMMQSGKNGSGLLDTSVNSHHQVIFSSPIRFKDVQGCDEVKEQLVQVVDYLKNPEKFERYGAKMPRGYLLEGPPGVGKTMLAKAVAGEANVPFLVISGAEFDEVFVGVGASRVRALFKDARSYSKAVIFIDEIDAVAGKRDRIDRSGSRQTLNQLLVEMDGFSTTSSVIVLAATNAVSSLDEALLRPGRFDKTLTLSPPNINGRKQLLARLLASIPSEMLARDVKAEELAAVTIGYTGADLANLINQAKLIAATDGSSGVISKAHLLKAMNFINLGPERSMVITEADRERLAFHEAGHAIVGLANPNHDPIHQATIVPHGRALGLVQSGPDSDPVFISKAMLEAKIDMALGGYMAEETIYGPENVSTGPSSDLQSVNNYARYMVKSGFGKRSGFYQLAEGSSEAAKTNFEYDVQDILNESRERVRKVLNDHKRAWHAIAEALLEKETLSREELLDIFKNPKPNSKSTITAMKAKSAKNSK